MPETHSLHLEALARTLETCCPALTSPGPAAPFFSLSDPLICRARSTDSALIRAELEKRCLSALTEPEQRVLWDRLLSLVEHTPLGDDLLALRCFSSLPCTGDHLAALLTCCFLHCALTAESAAPGLPAPRHDPASMDHYHRYASAFRFHLKTGGETRTFFFAEALLEYIAAHDLLIAGLTCRDGAVYAEGSPLPSGLKLVRVDTDADMEQARRAVDAHLNEFREKRSWAGEPLSSMLEKGLRKGSWMGYCYRTPEGVPACYLDGKLRGDGDLELGIQLTDPRYRRKHLASSLIRLFQLKFMSNGVVTGTYEENTGMRTALTHCGFREHLFRDPVSGLYTSRPRERVNPDPALRADPACLTHSVYYIVPSLISRIWDSTDPNKA